MSLMLHLLHRQLFLDIHPMGILIGKQLMVQNLKIYSCDQPGNTQKVANEKSLKIRLFLLRWRCVRDSNPWSPPWQGGTITNFANAPWSRWRELNPRVHLGKVAFYHWTTSAFIGEEGGIWTRAPDKPTYGLSRATSSTTWVLLQHTLVCWI